MKRETLVAASTALAWGLAVSAGAYGIVRAIQFFLYPDPNPATLVWSAHAGFFWRCWTCGYAGGLAAFVVFLVARARPESAARSLLLVVVVASAVLALQVAFLP